MPMEKQWTCLTSEAMFTRMTFFFRLLCINCCVTRWLYSIKKIYWQNIAPWLSQLYVNLQSWLWKVNRKRKQRNNTNQRWSQFPEFKASCRAEESFHRYFGHSIPVHSCHSCWHLVKIEACYVMKVSLETRCTTQTLLSTIKVMAEHDRQRVGVIGHSEVKWRQ